MTRQIEFGLAALLMVVMALVATGCTDYEREVGGDCSYHADCDERCLSGNRFPGGMCSMTCDDDYDCPNGTYCIEREGGICAVECRRDVDCRRDYECRGEDSQGRSGAVDVCIGD